MTGSQALLMSVMLAIGLSTSLSSAQDLRADARKYFKPIPSMVPSIKDNMVTREKVELGKMLFFDPRLSKSGVISCNTCHNLGTGGDDNLPTSVGHGWQKGPRNAPTVFNAVFNIAQFWDGRADDLKAQAKGPIQAGMEMANAPAKVVETLKSMPQYVARFKSAFPGQHNPVTFDNMARAIEAFEATLITPASRFDRYLEGNERVLTQKEKNGLRLFIDKGCVTCHAGVNLGGEAYFPFGLVQKPAADILPKGDRGRFVVTKTESDDYVFRASPLRNIALTAPYFHSGQVWDLNEAVAIMGTAQLGAGLTKREVGMITAFLLTLTGEQPKVEYPILPAETPATPKPEL